MTSFAAKPRHVLEKREETLITRMLPRSSWYSRTRKRYGEELAESGDRECGICEIPLAVLNENDERERGEREGEEERNVHPARG